MNKELLFYDSTPEGMAEGIEKAIEILVLDQKKYNDLRKKCHEYAKTRYSWNRHVRQLKSIIMDASAV